jgi:hypothetical protein
MLRHRQWNQGTGNTLVSMIQKTAFRQDATHHYIIVDMKCLLRIRSLGWGNIGGNYASWMLNRPLNH